MRSKLLLAVTAVFLSLARLSAGDVKIQSDRWMPLNGTPQEHPPGYAIELMVEVFTDSDTVTYTLEPWTDSIENTAKGKADAVIGTAKDEAPSLLFPQEAIARIDYGLWAKTGSPFQYSEASLGKARIGVIKGYTYWPALDKLIENKAANIVVFGGDNPLEDAINALAKDEIELLPESRPVFAWAIKEQERNLANFTSKFDHDGGLIYVAFTKSDRGKALAARWDAGIAALRKDGTLARILARYGVTDWK